MYLVRVVLFVILFKLSVIVNVVDEVGEISNSF